MNVTKDIRYIGVNDYKTDLFEGQYVVPNGIAYNSYVILDEKVAVMDTVDRNFTDEWLRNLDDALDGRKPDFLVVQHMEPDHSANIDTFLTRYPEAVVVASVKAFAMMKNFFGTDYADRRIVVGEGDTLSLGPMIPATRCCSPPTASANSTHWMWRRTGPPKLAAITSASWENTVPRSRSC